MRFQTPICQDRPVRSGSESTMLLAEGFARFFEALSAQRNPFPECESPGRGRGAIMIRGRHCRNLLGRTLDDTTLARTVADLRRELGLDRPVPDATAEDRREWRRWAAKAIAVVWGP